MIKVGVVGYGYWGKNIARCVQNSKNAQLVAICDSRKDSLERAQVNYSGISAYTDYKEMICNSDIDTVAIITPPITHFEIARFALFEGKNIFVEKPFTITVEDAQELISLSKKVNKIIMVDHTYIFTSAVKKLKEILNSNVLGKIYYVDSIRINLGLFQDDINVIWDLAPHDFSVLDYLFDSKPESQGAAVPFWNPGFSGRPICAYIFPGRSLRGGNRHCACVFISYPECQNTMEFSCCWYFDMAARTVCYLAALKSIYRTSH